MGIEKKRLRSSEPGIAQIRSQLRQRTYWQSKNALDQEFYLESIAISESLICDSLEGFLQKYGSLTHVSKLAHTISKIKKMNLKTSDFELMLQVEAWKELRDSAIHEIAKVHSSNTMDWDERLLIYEDTAREEIKLANQIKNFSNRKYIRAKKISIKHNNSARR